jgi:hypothetical protein
MNLTPPAQIPEVVQVSTSKQADGTSSKAAALIQKLKRCEKKAVDDFAKSVKCIDAGPPNVVPIVPQQGTIQVRR